MTKRILVIILTALVLAVWSAIIFRDKPVKLDEAERIDSVNRRKPTGKG